MPEAMRIGVIVHGAEVIDSGMALQVMDRLEKEAEVIATLGGAMGAAAIIDAGLEERISIVPRQLVSHAIREMDEGCDSVVMLNWSKTLESGLGFGGIVFGRVAGATKVPLLQLDRGFHVVWRPVLPDLLKTVLRELGTREVPAPPPEVPAEGTRTLHGIIPGENIWINGNVVGRATSSDVTVLLRDGKLEFVNVAVKEHGLQKVKVKDLRRAVIRSGSVRRTSSEVRMVPPPQGDKLILIDHRAEDSIFRARGARAAVTVGDDTTRISRSLLARLGVPVIGIVDGDEDRICLDDAAAPGSVRIVLRPGNDDQLGELVRRTIFDGGQETTYQGDLAILAEHIAALAGDALITVEKD
ncbi:MAG: DUF2117 domain-containing protein [Methanomassiliicoccus sp.]|nr:DUF2117 domain-containing protein [Methanomassiliicoccus sp.]